MACITVFAPPMAMATTRLTRVIHNQNVSAPAFVPVVDRAPVRMSWVVVTDNQGNRRLQMDWAPSENLL